MFESLITLNVMIDQFYVFMEFDILNAASAGENMYPIKQIDLCFSHDFSRCQSLKVVAMYIVGQNSLDKTN